MSTHDVLRSPAGVALLVDLATEHGMPATASLHGTSLTRSALDDLDAEVHLRDEIQIITNMLGALDVPGLGIEAGLRCHAASPGIWGLALMSSRTLGEAMQVGVSLAALSFCLCRLTVSPDMTDGYGRLILDPSHLPSDLRQFAVERDSTGIQTLQRDLLMSSDAQLQVAYTTERPADDIVRKYVDIFGVEPEFGAPQNCLIVSLDALNKPLPQANQYARSMAEKQAIELLRQRSARAGVAGLLRDMMLSSPAPVLTLDEAARQLTVSARTLRRHLAQEGVSLRDLQEETREALAEELVASGMPVAEIADRLGYSQTSSFTQAFRRWKGVGPREYRERLRDR
ncbi:AraC family transcriptional regulator [Mycolicibacterium sp. 141076]|uniref:AraC family transcriptional regulator n=1 Tax=Mycobacteriaceae TaxID=1762 RepID=UPI00299D9422|nr:AraC family transcriptional regulator [Mycolicibacterium sp. 141076]MDX1877766.1 AraC family transcriptional regulator [Mycolicibacterium sp. 141076]